MELSILGSGGCMVIPKPLCQCDVCNEARRKGPPFSRTGPSAFMYDENILIDTPADSSFQLNRSRIESVDHLMFSHLDPDHIEGFRVVEQIAIDYRTWKAYPEKQIRLILPKLLQERLKKVHTVYGSQVEYFEKNGFIKCVSFEEKTKIGDIDITALPVNRESQVSFIYVFEKNGCKMVYAPCDIKPFPENREEVQKADLLLIQPGIFEDGLKHQFTYPAHHISRTTLYTIDETIALSKRISAKQVMFIHLEEYWNRSHTDYFSMQYDYENVQFAYDGMRVKI
ncbi:MAG: MBL fold metallo-hydrolase [Desulfobacterales bacterium]